MSLANHQILTSINVAAQPSSISVSPDAHWLLAAHYGNNAVPASPTNALTLIDLTNNYASQTFALSNPPLGVAFGIDGNALVVTTEEFIRFSPTLGTTQTLQTIARGGHQCDSATARRASPKHRAGFDRRFARRPHHCGIRRHQPLLVIPLQCRDSWSHVFLLYILAGRAKNGQPERRMTAPWQASPGGSRTRTS